MSDQIVGRSNTLFLIFRKFEICSPDDEARACRLAKKRWPDDFRCPAKAPTCFPFDGWRHLPLAATYWSGLEQAWPRFTEEERTEVRAFFADSKPADSLTPSLYAALLGLSSNHAQTFAMQVAQDGLLDIVVESAITRIKVIEYSYYWRPY